MKVEKAVLLCKEFIKKYKHKTHTDYMITENSIKLFFYFNSSDFGDEYSELSSDLNSLLVKHELTGMCDFYMKLVVSKNSSKYQCFSRLLCREIFSNENVSFACILLRIIKQMVCRLILI